jgi:hypothetical protein
MPLVMCLYKYLPIWSLFYKPKRGIKILWLKTVRGHIKVAKKGQVTYRTSMIQIYLNGHAQFHWLGMGNWAWPTKVR